MFPVLYFCLGPGQPLKNFFSQKEKEYFFKGKGLVFKPQPLILIQIPVNLLGYFMLFLQFFRSFLYFEKPATQEKNPQVNFFLCHKTLEAGDWPFSLVTFSCFSERAQFFLRFFWAFSFFVFGEFSAFKTGLGTNFFWFGPFINLFKTVGFLQSRLFSGKGLFVVFFCKRLALLTKLFESWGRGFLPKSFFKKRAFTLSPKKKKFSFPHLGLSLLMKWKKNTPLNIFL